MPHAAFPRWDYKFESAFLQQRVCELSVPERRADRRERPVKFGGPAFDVLLAPIEAAVRAPQRRSRSRGERNTRTGRAQRDESTSAADTRPNLTVVARGPWAD